MGPPPPNLQTPNVYEQRPPSLPPAYDDHQRGPVPRYERDPRYFRDDFEPLNRGEEYHDRYSHGPYPQDDLARFPRGV